MGETEKSNESSRLSPASTLKKLTIDRFVLAHFFLLFFVSFIIGILFLHSTMLWQGQTYEESILSTLKAATYGFDYSKRQQTFNSNNLKVSFNENATLTTAVT